MATLKQKWDKLLENSTAFATVLILVAAGLALLIAVAIGVVLAKLSAFVK
jgi:hypothetical protein